MSQLRLLQISDSALPISGYTHSWGLESAISRGSVKDAESLERWTRLWLRTCLGPLEGVLVSGAFRACGSEDFSGIDRLNRLAEISIVPPTIRMASQEMGEQLIQLGMTWEWSVRRLSRFAGQASGRVEPWHHAVAFGLLGAIAGADVDSVLTAFLHQSALAMVSTGVRAIPVGHTHGQQILAYLHDDIRESVVAIVNRDPETAGAGCPNYEILCDEQTRLYARMFRS